MDDPNEYLVISTWKTLEAWNWWLSNNERAELEGRVDALLAPQRFRRFIAMTRFYFSESVFLSSKISHLEYSF